MLFPPPGTPSIRIVLGLGRNKGNRSKLSNRSSWDVCFNSEGDNGDDGGGGGQASQSMCVKKLI